ncbi:MAG: alanine racemase, partial [Candidatus Aureabacteria bacterium]|nr:alanine racemase [Candidatus Auribacterota bacterium]
MPFFEVNLSNYRHNIETIKSFIPRDCSLMAIVKSDAYGLGIEKISREAHDCGIRWFGIAKAEEALLLRDVLGGDVRIVQVSPFTAKDAPRLVEAGVIPIISSIDEARALSEESLKKGRKTSVHLGIDTGMGRMGFMPRDAVTVFQELVSLEALSLDGLFSHFPSADEDDEKFTKGQLMSFKELASEMERKLNKKLVKHIANSSAVFRYPDSHMDLVRCGIASYGASPSAGFML